MMVEVAATLRKSRSRSQFNLYGVLGLNVYQFGPNDFLEITGENEKANFSRIYEEYTRKKQEKKQRARDKKKQKQVLQEKLKPPLHGNIAASFLFNKDNAQINNMMMKANSAACDAKDESSEDEETMKEPHEVQGFFKEKLKRNLGNINHFIQTMRKT